MSSRLRTIGLLGFAAFVLLIALSLEAHAAPRLQAAALDAADQAIAGGAINVTSVTADQDGFVAAFRDRGGIAGNLLGFTAVKKGANSNVKIALTGDVPNGSKIWVRLHIDAGTIGTLEFPGPDLPAKDASGNPVQKQIVIIQGQPAGPTATKSSAAATTTPSAVTPTRAITLPNTGGDEGGGRIVLLLTATVLLVLAALIALYRHNNA